MSCHKDKHRKDHCPTPKKTQLCNCQTMTLPRVVELGAVAQSILMINSGNNFSQERTLVIEAEVSVIATNVVPATAAFSLIVDGVPLDPVNQIVVNEVDEGFSIGDARSTVIKATLRVGPGTHMITLQASSNQDMEINPGEGGASLKICEKRQ